MFYFLPFFLPQIARYGVIRGGCCFIYLESTDLVPLYVFSLADVKPEIEDAHKPDKASCTVNPVNNSNKSRDDLVTVLLRYKRDGNLAYQFTFETEKDKSIVKRFIEVVQVNGQMNQPLKASVVEGTSTTKNNALATKKESKK